MPVNDAVTQMDSAAIDIKMPAPGDEGYNEWRRTGKLPQFQEEEPAEKKPEVKQDETQVQERETGSSEEEESATSESVSQAASEAARPQKGKKSADARKAELNTEIRELAKTAADLRKVIEEARSQSSVQRDGKQEAQPAAEKKTEAKPEPQLDDKKPDGTPKYKTYAEYQKDWAGWVFAEAKREAAAVTTDHLSKTQLEQKTAEAQKVVDQAWGNKVQEARAKYANFDTVAKNLLSARDRNGKEFFLPRGSAIDQFLLESPQGADVFYHLAQHANEDSVQRIFERTPDGKFFVLNPVQQVLALQSIAQSMDVPVAPVVKKAPSATPVTKAPPPPHQVTGKAATNVDEAEQAVKDGDFAAFQAAENAKALEKAQRGRRRA